MNTNSKYIIIVNSPLFEEYNKLYDEDSLPPLGLGYIATNLINRGFKVELIDAIASRLSLENLLDLLSIKKPDYLAINIFTTNYHLVKKIVEAVDYKTHIIIGGLATKELYKRITEWQTSNNLDIVTGDGELITNDIINDSLIESPFYVDGNVRVFRVDSKSKYYVSEINNIPLDRSVFVNEPVYHPFGFVEANIVTSRGCIYNCSFCAAAYSQNKEYGTRERSIKSVQMELREIQINYPEVNSIRVLDDLFLKTRKHVVKAIETFSPFNIKWRSMAHVMTFHNVEESTLKSLKKSGCNELFIGIESGSPKVLKSINKTSNVSLIVKNLGAVLKAGISIKGYFIYGFPNESREDMELTYQLAMKLSKIAEDNGVVFRTSVFQYRPYHGTAIYHDLITQGHDLSSAQNIRPNDSLSGLISRFQFNFHSDNFSKVDLNVIHDYICRTTNITRTDIIEQLVSQNRTA